MKKIIPALLATVLSASAGCDTRIDSEEVHNALSAEFRCEVTKGSVFSGSQAEVIHRMVNVMNDSNCWGDGLILSETCSSYKNLVNSLTTVGVGDTNTINATKVELKNLKQEIYGGTVAYNTMPMYRIYQYVKAAVPEGVIDENNPGYCACGFEFCEAGADCVTDPNTQLPICTFSTSIATMVGEDCDPVLIKPAAVQGIVARAMYPLVWKVSDLKGNFDRGNYNIIDSPCQSKIKANANPDLCSDVSVNNKNGIGYLFYQDVSDFKSETDIKMYQIAVAIITFMTNAANYDEAKAVHQAETIEVSTNGDYNTATICSKCIGSDDENCKCGANDTMTCEDVDKENGSCKVYKGVRVDQRYYKMGYERDEKGNIVKDEQDKPKTKKYYYPLCIGEVVHLGNGLRPGATNNVFYFNTFRTIIKSLLTYGMSNEELAVVAKSENAEALEIATDRVLMQIATDIYIKAQSINQTSNVYNYFASNVYVPEYGKACKRKSNTDGDMLSECAKDDNNKDITISNADIAAAVREYFNLTYTADNTVYVEIANNIKSKLSVQKMERIFYAFLADLAVKTETDASSALNRSFSVNLDCVTPVSGVGDPAGVKKYCSADDNQLVGVKNIIDSFEMSYDVVDNTTSRLGAQSFARANFIDLMLMGIADAIPVDISQKVDPATGQVIKLDKSETVMVSINPNASKNAISFTNALGTTEFLKGKWQAMRCPGGTSCTVAKQCGDCANTDAGVTMTLYRLPQNDAEGKEIEKDSNGEYQSYLTFPNATCKAGVIIENTDQPAATTTDAQ